jgi:3-carboxy-cis,cis-muconate cycloisomerase
MAVSPFSSVLFGKLFSDQEIAGLFADRARLERMLAVEAALARVEGRLGIIPWEAGERIATAAERFSVDPASLAEKTARDGVPVPALIASLREAVGDTDQGYVHWGATSQDIVDTAFVLIARDVITLLERRLVDLVQVMGRLAERHRKTVMPGRTRFQVAVPVTFGAKVAAWTAPLIRDLDRLEELRPRLLVVSLAGAAGTQSGLGRQGMAVESALAQELGLGVAIGPWHSARDSMTELAGWLALLTGTVGKIGADILLLAQTEIAEVRPVDGGASSAMPHKSNPVAAELLVTIARFNAGRVGSLYDAMVHAHERDGSAWMLEWLILPEMMVAAGAALAKAQELIGGLAVDEAAMCRHVTEAPALILSEAALYALADHMPKSQAETLVKQAIDEAASSGEHLIDVLARMSDAKVDWPSLRDAHSAVQSAERMIDRVISRMPR